MHPHEFKETCAKVDSEHHTRLAVAMHPRETLHRHTYPGTTEVQVMYGRRADGPTVSSGVCGCVGKGVRALSVASTKAHNVPVALLVGIHSKLETIFVPRAQIRTNSWYGFTP